MLSYIAKKFAELIPTLVGISILSFILVRLVPGDPVLLLLGERGADPKVYTQMKKDMGLDLPLWRQYGRYMGKVLKGDLGTSIVSKRPVADEFWDRFPATLELGLLAMVFAICIGIPLGVIAALKRQTIWDYFLMGISITGYSMPIFWWGLLLILLFSVNLGLTPVSGRLSVMFDVEPWTGFLFIDTLTPEVLKEEGLAPFWSAVKHIILPSFAMGTIPLAVMARMTRSSLLEILGEDFIRTAKAKGLPTRIILINHALRNALIPIITTAGLLFGSIITGAILTETIFSWPGIGKWFVTSIRAIDYPVIQGGILLITTFIVLINILVDILYAWVNPQMRKELQK